MGAKNKTAFGGKWITAAKTSHKWAVSGYCRMCKKITCAGMWLNIYTGECRCKKCFTPDGY